MQTSTHAHWRGLDGLRALAVIAVVIYHFSAMTLPGGYLGVDIFFVISGYLITRLIAEEFVRRHRIDAPAFYRRRARRLLPALAIVLASVGASALIWRDQLATVRPGIVFSALFSANWWLAYAHQPYFVATGRPSMLQHLWSLGVEEQFYLLWPLIVAATLGASWRRLQRRDLDPRAAVRRLLMPLSVVAAVLSLLSTGLTWLLADASNVPYGSDGSTLYYGTDTHCMGLLLGAALGAWAVGRPLTDASASARPAKLTPVIDVLGLGALVTVLVLTRTYGSYSHSLYRGGFLVVAALVTIVIAAATYPASRLGAALDVPLLRWIGVRSYSIYLWHWPIAVVTRPGIDNSMPTWLDQLLRVTMTIVLADMTYRYIETPVRRLGFSGALSAVGSRLRRATGPSLARLAAAGLTAIPVMAVGVLVIGPSAPQAAAAQTGHGGTHLSLNAPAAGKGSHRGQAAATRHMPKISGFGDSVMLDARQTLARAFGGGTIDAVVGRQPGPILDDVYRDAQRQELNPVVIIHAGNNGLIDPDQLKRTLRYLSGPVSSEVQVILVLNDHLDPYDHSWQHPNNSMLAKVVPEFRKAVFVNWNQIAFDHPGWLYSDDLHLKPQGAVGYANVLAGTYREWVAKQFKPTPSPTPKPSPKPTPTAKPTPTPSATPTAIATVTSTPAT